MPARLRAALLLAALLALVPTADVGATSPGANGLIAVGTEPAPPAKDRRVSLTRPDGEPAGALAGDLADLGDFRWSPDGARLVGFYYDPYRDPHAPALRPFGWYVVTRDGKAWTALPDATRSASFLPDGRVLLLQGGSASVPRGPGPSMVSVGIRKRCPPCASMSRSRASSS